MEITFNQIHEIVIETLNLKEGKPNFFIVIGKWFFNFLNSSDKKVSIHVPKFEENTINSIVDYTRVFSLAYRILHKPRINNYKDTCLFNIFDYSKRRNNFINVKSTFDFVKENNHFLIWSENIITSKQRFIPIFLKNQIDNTNWAYIYNTFKLFKIIESKALISYPILIDIEKDLCLSLITGEEIEPEKIILFKSINWDSKTMTDKEAAEQEDELLKKDIVHQINIRYPYHKNIHSYLTNIGKKRFELILNSRFYYNNISDEDIILLPTELYQEQILIKDFSSKFTIINTNHSIELFSALYDLKLDWRNYELNKFTTPFPKYWFTFINQSIPKEEWFKIFKSDYPNLAEKPIINLIKSIIELIYDLNWSKQFISEIKNPFVLLPEKRGIAGKKIEKSLNSFKNYLLNNNPNTIILEHSENFNYDKYEDIIILDGFNLINLVNILQRNDNLKILIPDFIYFGYQPWIKYHLLSYQFDSLFNSKRELLDCNYSLNKEIFLKQRNEIVKGVKSDISQYKKKYKVEDIDVTEEEIAIDSEDIIFRNEEELEINLEFNNQPNSEEILIENVLNQILLLKSKEQVLIQKTSLICCEASQLKVGDYFVVINELDFLIDKNSVINKLSRIPDSVINYRQELNKIENVYQVLTKLGLEYKSESYFLENYTLGNNFKLPKKKNNWKIICEYIGISTNDMYQAWISYYGSRHINEIKDIYTYSLNLFIQNSLFGEIDNPYLINKIVEYINSKNAIFEDYEEVNTVEIAKSITTSIINELSFHEVKGILTA